MPEGPEVRIFSDQLNKEFGGQSLQNIEIVGGRFLKEPIAKFNQLIFPMKNFKSNTKGKFLYWQFDEDDVLFITLGMAASFGPKSKHSALKFTFDKSEVYFNDIRHFGTLKIEDENSLHIKLQSLGWDILQDNIPIDIITRLKTFNKKTVAELLMDQKIQSGIGNYIKSEACYAAGILPTRLVSSLSEKEIISLYEAAKQIAKISYSEGGATISTFADMYGNTGKFFDKFKVYGKKKDPLNNTVTKITTKDGRTSFYVENIQK